MDAETSRRSFLGGAAAALAGGVAQAGPARKVVRVAGRPARVIDIHAHCEFPEADPVLAGTPFARKTAPLAVFGPERIAEMERRGIDLQVLSVNFYWWYGADQAAAEKVVDIHHQGLTKLIAAWPGRLTALSSPALQFPELAARQLEHGVRDLGFRGASIGGHVQGQTPTSARFDPFWAKCQELDVPVFMHPTAAANVVRDGAWAGTGDLANVIGNPLETTIFLARMIYDGVFDRFPRLKVCAAHGAGYLPSYLGRFEVGCAVREGSNCRNLKPPSAYLRSQIYADSMVFSEEALRHLAAVMGTSQIVYGSDQPYVWPDTIDTIANARTFTPAEKVAILGGNVARLLKLDT